LAIALLILAWRIARWLFLGAVWLIALTVVGVVLLTKLVAHQAPIWSARLHAHHARVTIPRAKVAP
jgi:fatty acid desaturase